MAIFFNRISAVLAAVLLLSGCAPTLEEELKAKPFVAGDTRALVMIAVRASRNQPQETLQEMRFGGSGAAGPYAFEANLPAQGKTAYRYFLSKPGTLHLTNIMAGPYRHFTTPLNCTKYACSGGTSYRVRNWLVKFSREDLGSPALNALMHAPSHVVEAGKVNFIGTYVIAPAQPIQSWMVNFHDYRTPNAFRPPRNLPGAPYIDSVEIDEVAARREFTGSRFKDLPFRIAAPTPARPN